MGPLYTIYRVTSYLRLLSVLTCSLNVSFLARLVSDDCGSLEKLEFGAPSSPATPEETVSLRVRVLVRGYLRVRLDLPSYINSRYICGFPKLGANDPYYGSPQRVQSGIIKFYWYDFLLVMYCTRGRILHRFRDIALHMSNVAIFGYHLLRFTPDGGVSLGRSL